MTRGILLSIQEMEARFTFAVGFTYRVDIYCQHSEITKIILNLCPSKCGDQVSCFYDPIGPSLCEKNSCSRVQGCDSIAEGLQEGSWSGDDSKSIEFVIPKMS